MPSRDVPLPKKTHPAKALHHRVNIKHLIGQKSTTATLIGDYHAFDLIRHVSNYHWKYCGLCAKVRAKLRLAGVNTSWIEKGLSAAAPIPIDDYEPKAAIKILEDALRDAYLAQHGGK